jgi:hypothetical protein
MENQKIKISKVNTIQEKRKDQKTYDIDNGELGLEILEVDSSTVMDEMGASIGYNSCSRITPTS